MFSQSADQDASDQSPAPIGMRELPPQPPKPVMPAFPATPSEAQSDDEARPGPDDSVIASDDHFEGTFTSRGTVRVEGSVNGRIEAVRVRIQEGALVEADVVVDEAIIAGEFTGNLTCRRRLEARPTGRISGHVETYKLMLHEGAAVEGEMHMLPDPAASPSETIRGTAPVRGETAPTTGQSDPPSASARSVAKPATVATPPAPETTSRLESRATAPAQSVAETMRVTPRATMPASSGANGSTSNGSDSRL